MEKYVVKISFNVDKDSDRDKINSFFTSELVLQALIDYNAYHLEMYSIEEIRKENKENGKH